MQDNESNTTGKTGRGMNVALGATIKGKNQRALRVFFVCGARNSRRKEFPASGMPTWME
jgi:hypothetical protein